MFFSFSIFRFFSIFIPNLTTRTYVISNQVNALVVQNSKFGTVYIARAILIYNVCSVGLLSFQISDHTAELFQNKIQDY